MGKKHQRDREERREKYASRQQKESNKNKLIASSILAVIVVIIAYAGYEFSTLTVNAPGGPEGAGAINSAHVHAGMLVKVFGDTFDFSLPPYQVQTPWIHFEGQNGDTVHRHATGVKLDYLFESMAMDVTDECFSFPPSAGRSPFCTDDTYSLKFYVNGNQVSNISEYVVQDNDKILISFGSDTPEEINEQLQEAENIVLDIR